jgi:hypothetical protein
MMYDHHDYPSLPHLNITSQDRATPLEVPMEPPQDDEVRTLIVEVIQRWPGWPAERIQDRLRRASRRDVSLAAINYVLAEQSAG